MKKIDSNELRKAQLLMLDILSKIDTICINNDIDYWLDFGTLLGAIRHKGFIPWDDDIDICMERSNYNKFSSLAVKELPSYLFFQTVDTDSGYPIRHIPCKVRLNNTEIIEKVDLNLPKDALNFHRGLFVDIFPVDCYSESKFFRILPRLFTLLHSLKSYSVLNKQKNLFRSVLVRLVSIIPWSFFDRLKKVLIKKLNQKYNNVLGLGVEVGIPFTYCKKAQLHPLIRVEFEGHHFNAPNDYHNWLITRYGPNYMELPPENSRRWHIVDIKFPNVPNELL
jgi:lipopolysaccharide cholinephosphotransferase